MKEIPITATDEEIKQVMREWVDLLAQGRFDDAVAMLAPEFVHDNHYVDAGEPQVWTGALVEALIRNYGFLEETELQDGFYKVVSVDEDIREEFEHHLTIYRKPIELAGQMYFGWADAHLPLEDEEGLYYSDLSAQFCLREVSGDKLVLMLDNIHMM